MQRLRILAFPSELSDGNIARPSWGEPSGVANACSTGYQELPGFSKHSYCNQYSYPDGAHLPKLTICDLFYVPWIYLWGWKIVSLPPCLRYCVVRLADLGQLGDPTDQAADSPWSQSLPPPSTSHNLATADTCRHFKSSTANKALMLCVYQNDEHVCISNLGWVV